MNPVKNLWNDTPSEVLNHYQQLVHKVLQVNSRCQVLLYDLLTRAQDFYPGKMKSEDFLYLVNRKAAFINNKLSNLIPDCPILDILHLLLLVSYNANY